jgi:hypothetical protein
MEHPLNTRRPAPTMAPHHQARLTLDEVDGMARRRILDLGETLFHVFHLCP